MMHPNKKRMDANTTHREKCNGKYKRTQQAILKISGSNTPLKTDVRPLTSHLKNIQVKRRHAGHCCRSKDELNHMVHPYKSSNTGTAWKKFGFILSDASVFYKIDYQFIAV